MDQWRSVPWQMHAAVWPCTPSSPGAHFMHQPTDSKGHQRGDSLSQLPACTLPACQLALLLLLVWVLRPRLQATLHMSCKRACRTLPLWHRSAAAAAVAGNGWVLLEALSRLLLPAAVACEALQQGLVHSCPQYSTDSSVVAPTPEVSQPC
jgi:hypothetical protein